jgi:predicted SnoaL-like aldol condensation-catalyzing enzyme
MRKNIFCIFILVALMGCTSAHNTELQNKGSKTKMTNKEKAIAFIQAFETGNSNVLEYVNGDKFISHNAYFPPGDETLKAFFTGKPTGTKVKTIRAFTDGDFVIMHNLYIGAEGYSGPIITFDLCRFESGQIVEHWDNITMETTQTVSGHTQLDGPTETTELDKTASNKALAEGFVANVLIKGEGEKLEKYLHKDIIQHNPMVGDGISGITDYFMQMEKNKTKMEHKKIHYVLGEGNFVLVVIEGLIAGKPAAYYDLFRVENNKIVELWDVIEEVLPQDKWTHDRGKY